MKRDEAIAGAISRLIRGESRDAVFEWLRAEYSRRKAPDALRRVEAKLSGIADLDPRSRLGLTLLSLEDLYRRAVAEGELAVALRILRELATLSGARELPGARREIDEDDEDLEAPMRIPQSVPFPELVRLVREGNRGE